MSWGPSGFILLHEECPEYPPTPKFSESYWAYPINYSVLRVPGVTTTKMLGIPENLEYRVPEIVSNLEYPVTHRPKYPVSHSVYSVKYSVPGVLAPQGY